MKSNASKLIGVTLIGIAAIALILYFGPSIGTAQTSTLTSARAVERALSYARDDGFLGGITSKPRSIYGKVMSLGEAMATLTGHKLPKNAPVPKGYEKKVWLIVFEAEAVEHPKSPTGTTEKVFYNQMVEVIDAKTGEAIAERMFRGNGQIPTTDFIQLKITEQGVVELPTLLRNTAIPKPTVPAVPTKSP